MKAYLDAGLKQLAAASSFQQALTSLSAPTTVLPLGKFVVTVLVYSALLAYGYITGITKEPQVLVWVGLTEFGMNRNI